MTYPIIDRKENFKTKPVDKCLQGLSPSYLGLAPLNQATPVRLFYKI